VPIGPFQQLNDRDLFHGLISLGLVICTSFHQFAIVLAIVFLYIFQYLAPLAPVFEVYTHESFFFPPISPMRIGAAKLVQTGASL
jgi:hypothetical protein